jgi:antitoxin (DNA-binding transcriptional repressor) of toxin-antitoxin stability system
VRSGLDRELDRRGSGTTDAASPAKGGEMTQRLPTAAARKSFAAVLRDSAAGERIKLTRYNKTIAVVIPKKDLTDLEECEKARAKPAEHVEHPTHATRGHHRHNGEEKP